jgi:site-specific DNA recombinase
MTSAAIYARVSSARQREEQTIASQTAALLEHAAPQGLEVPAGWVFEDEGYSGATLVRPALERLRDLAAQVGVELVLCYAPDRLARKYAYQALLIEEFARSGTEVRFLNGPASDRPEDALLVQFQGMIAKYERAQIGERTRRGKLHRKGGLDQRALGRPLRLPLHPPERARRGPLRGQRARGQHRPRGLSALRGELPLDR